MFLTRMALDENRDETKEFLYNPGRMQREIGFKYIKFSGIFSDDLRVCTRLKDGGLAFNFAYLDKIFDYLLEVRLKPFIQLSYMPYALAKKPE